MSQAIWWPGQPYRKPSERDAEVWRIRQDCAVFCIRPHETATNDAAIEIIKRAAQKLPQPCRVFAIPVGWKLEQLSDDDLASIGLRRTQKKPEDYDRKIQKLKAQIRRMQISIEELKADNE